MMGDLPDLLQKPDPDLPLTMLRAARPGVTSGLGRLVNQTLGGAEPASATDEERSPSPDGLNGDGAKPKKADSPPRHRDHRECKQNATPEHGRKPACSPTTSGSERQRGMRELSPSPVGLNGRVRVCKPNRVAPERGQKAGCPSATSSGNQRQRGMQERPPSGIGLNGREAKQKVHQRCRS